MSYTTDDEQVEALKRWWRENGRSVIAGVVIAAIAVIGWKQWESYQSAQAEGASNEYLAFLEQVQAEQPTEAAVERGRQIIADYPRTPYAALTALWLARYYVDQGQLDQAAEQLRWAADKADGEPMRHVARLRLARVLLAAGKADEALAVLDKAPAAEAFASQYAEVRGDVLAAKGQRDDAVAAYRRALAGDVDAQRRQFIELKLNDLGVAQEEPAA